MMMMLMLLLMMMMTMMMLVTMTMMMLLMMMITRIGDPGGRHVPALSVVQEEEGGPEHGGEWDEERIKI